MKLLALLALIILSTLNTKLYLDEEYIRLGVHILVQILLVALIIKDKN